MKNTKSLLAALIILVTASGTALAADGIIAKDAEVAGSYCHQKFLPMEGASLASDQPVLKDRYSGDVIDFYGSCDESPVGQDQMQEQRLERQHRWANNYED